MCGIAGVAGRGVTQWIHPMVARQVHRGPDDAGVFVDEPAAVAIGMRRLSILDLEGGHQPMSNDARTLWIVFNGEIFNSPELRAALERDGVRFSTTNSDTEVLLKLYEARGEDMLQALNGMFAFVIYDARRGRLFGARDRLGIKPLYYSCAGGRFAFASELKALVELPWLPRELNLESCYHYLSLLYVPGRESILKGINRLQPAESFRFDIESRDLTFSRYWRIEEKTAERPEFSPADDAARIRAGLRDAVKRWTLADVPIGCSLSGGLDSSAVVGLMRENGVREVRTYSVGFEEESVNELPLARLVARKWETEHHEHVLSTKGLLDALPAMVWHLDEPYGGGLPSWYVFDVMSKDVKVAMTGTGGDELFGGYGKYRYLERGVAWRLWSLATGGRLASGPWTGERLARFVAGSRTTCFHDAFYYFSDASKQAFFNGLPEGAGTARMLEQMLGAAADAAGRRNAASVVDMRTQLPEEFLMMTDRFSMAHSIEARVPFLDHEFVELCLSIPASRRFDDEDYKYLLRQAIADLLPEELLTAPKRGFVLPIADWLRGGLRGLVETLLGRDRLQRQGIFKPSLYDEVVRPFFSGGDATRPVQIWALLMFQLWHWVYIEQRFDVSPRLSANEIAS